MLTPEGRTILHAQVDDDVREGGSLEKAREALERGRLKRALRLTWEAGLAASSVNDAPRLQQAIDLAGRIRDQATGRRRKDAAQLVAYCSHALAEPRTQRLGWFRSAFRGPSAAAPPENGKVCPDCAETVKAAARVCRFCGHRFDVETD